MGKENKEPITKDQVLEVKCQVGDIMEQISFLSKAFGDLIPDFDEKELHGLSQLLAHIDQDGYKVLDLLDEMEEQASEVGPPTDTPEASE